MCIHTTGPIGTLYHTWYSVSRIIQYYQPLTYRYIYVVTVCRRPRIYKYQYYLFKNVLIIYVIKLFYVLFAIEIIVSPFFPNNLHYRTITYICR